MCNTDRCWGYCVSGFGAQGDERLWVDGRDRIRLAAGVILQVDSVCGVLAELWPQVSVAGVLCFVGAEWTRSKPNNVNGVVVNWPKTLSSLVCAPGTHGLHVEAIASHLRRALKQAT